MSRRISGILYTGIAFIVILTQSGFAQNIPLPLVQRIKEFQKEIKASPTNAENYSDRWKILRDLYAEQTNNLTHIDYTLEQLRSKAKALRRFPSSVSGEVRAAIEGQQVNESLGYAALDAAILRLGIEKSTAELEIEKERFRNDFPSPEIRYSIEYEGEQYTVYWGELHGHTNLSDGVNTVKYYYRFGKEITNLDFCSLTDHGWYMVDKDDVWQETIHIADDLNEPRRYVTLPGVEWTSRGGHGHINLIYYGTDRPQSAPNARSEFPNTVQGLYAHLDQADKDVVVIRNHTASERLGTDWTYHNPKWNMLIDIVSSMSIGYTTYYNFIHERTMEKALAEGYRFGVVGTSDTHTSWPGSGNLTAVFAQDLSRKSIGENLVKRFCYAAEDRILVDFRINGMCQGSELIVQKSQPLTVSITAEGLDELSTIIVIKNNRVFTTLSLDHLDSKTINIEQQLDEEAKQINEAVDMYFVIVTQKNTKRAWSSPIWITHEQ